MDALPATGAIRVERRPSGVAVVVLDHPTKRVNTLSPALLDEFMAEVAPLLEDPAVRGLVLASAKDDTFIAGADLEVLEGMTEHEAQSLSKEGNAVLSRVAAAPKPVVAAVHGAALGGGLEVVLACSYILASDDPATVLGLPEVMLGLLPGGGGTQRLVQRVGLMAALPMLLAGKRVRARRARRMGLVDAITTAGGIADAGERAALALAEGRLRRRPRRKSLFDRLAGLAPVRALVLRQARQQVLRQTRGLYPAPEAILDCVATGLSRGEQAGLERESHHFGRLVVSFQSRSLVGLFHASNQLKKEADDEEGRPVERLAVLGAGFMGAGVASVSLGLGPVVLRDLSDEALSRAGKTIDDGLVKQLRSGAIRRAQADRRRSRLLLTTEVSDLAGADLVVEAVFEDLELKRRVLAEVEEQVGETAVFASNTSALPIADIAAEARHPERVLGMHYFSPVPKMPLLEIVVTDKTAPSALATARALGIAQGKTCVVVRDGPGFFTTRILAPYLDEALRLVEEGARTEDVDRAMRNFGFPVGPLALIDEVGIDVGAHVARDLGPFFAERGLEVRDPLAKLIHEGFEGRKNRRGFYAYPKRGRKRPDPSVYGLLGGEARRQLDPAEAQDRLCLVMVNEAALCLGDGVVASPRDGDVAAVFGLGFPPLSGGPFRWADTVGVREVVDRLERLAERHGARFAPAPALAEAASAGTRFHPDA